MKKIIATIIAFSFIIGVIISYLIPPKKRIIDPNSPYQITSCTKDKKKVLIFSSRGGGGHISVMNAIEEYLAEDFCVGHSFIFSDVLNKMDPVQWITNKKVTGEDWYNFFMKKKWFGLTNMVYNFGSWYYTFRRASIEPVLKEYLEKYKPDLIISVIPLVNNLILTTAEQLNIPFLLVPTDLDATIALNGIESPTYDKFYLALSYENDAINQSVKKSHIDSKHISYVGFPVKKAFFEPHNIRSLKKELRLPDNKPIVLLLMGAQGSQDIYKMSKQLSKVTNPMHLVIVLGKSEHLRKHIDTISFPKHITTTILGFTNRIPDYMHAADLLISKSGSVSVNEAIYAQLPILLDATSELLAWEKLNHTIISHHQLGHSIKRYNLLSTMVNELITHQDLLDQYKENMENFKTKNPELELKLLIKKILYKGMAPHTVSFLPQKKGAEAPL